MCNCSHKEFIFTSRLPTHSKDWKLEQGAGTYFYALNMYWDKLRRGKKVVWQLDMHSAKNCKKQYRTFTVYK